MDNNGKYSEIRSARINAQTLITLSLQPVPFYKITELQVNGIAPKTFRLVITDMMGKVIQQKNITNTEEYRKVPIDLSSSSSGTYILKVIQDEKIATVKAVKL